MKLYTVYKNVPMIDFNTYNDFVFNTNNINDLYYYIDYDYVVYHNGFYDIKDFLNNIK